MLYNASTHQAAQRVTYAHHPFSYHLAAIADDQHIAVISTIDPADAPRAVKEYLEVLDEAAFGAATPVQPKFTSHSDPASQWTAARKGPAFFAYSDNYLIDTDLGVIVDVEATRSIRQAEVGSTKTMLNRVKGRFSLHPERLIADTA